MKRRLPYLYISNIKFSVTTAYLEVIILSLMQQHFGDKSLSGFKNSNWETICTDIVD
jgi:hypothetical protein